MPIFLSKGADDLLSGLRVKASTHGVHMHGIYLKSIDYIVMLMI